MRHELPTASQFYITAPQSCPYLDNRVERKLFTALQGEGATALNDSLSRQGFRRSQNVLYRPACAECSACFSARIKVADFSETTSQRRVLKRNRSVIGEASTPWATEEQFRLFRSYLDARHADGGMADMDIFEFSAMIEETPVRTRVIEYRRTHTVLSSPDLIAASLTDVLSDGLSMVYSFFEPTLSHNSLGTYIILDHIRIAREANLPYVYLGYWVPGSEKMAYKSNFSALEIFHDGAWHPYDDSCDYQQASTKGAAPISQQIAEFSFAESEGTNE